MSAPIFFSLPAVSTKSKGHSIRPPRFEQKTLLRGCKIPLTSMVFPSRSCAQAFANSVGTPEVLQAIVDRPKSIKIDNAFIICHLLYPLQTSNYSPKKTVLCNG